MVAEIVMNFWESNLFILNRKSQKILKFFHILMENVQSFHGLHEKYLNFPDFYENSQNFSDFYANFTKNIHWKILKNSLKSARPITLFSFTAIYNIHWIFIKIVQIFLETQKIFLIVRNFPTQFITFQLIFIIFFTSVQFCSSTVIQFLHNNLIFHLIKQIFIEFFTNEHFYIV